MFTVLQIQLACEKFKEEVPRWQSLDKHERLRVIMSNRPDLIESEMSGLAFDSLQQCFRPGDIEAMFTIEPLTPVLHNEIFIIVDSAGGGPHSDYALVSFQRDRGNVTIVGIESLNTKEPSKQFYLLEEHIRALRQLRQLEAYSFKYKEAANTFQKSRMALSGKIVGVKALRTISPSVSSWGVIGHWRAFCIKRRGA
jgi:hypothetical protein